MALVHVIVVFPPAELGSLVIKTQKMLIETETRGAVNPGWNKTAIKFLKFKFIDDSVD